MALPSDTLVLDIRGRGVSMSAIETRIAALEGAGAAPRIVRGTVNTSGGATVGTGFTSARPNAGEFTITFTDAFASAPVVLTTASALNAQIVSAPSTTGIAVTTFDSAGSVANRAFSFVAVAVA